MTTRRESRNHRIRNRRERGFTMLEVLVTMAVLGLAAAFGVPSVLKGLERFRVEGAAEGVAQMLARARGEAIRRGVPVVVALDPANDQIIAFADVDDASGEPRSDLIYNPCESCGRTFRSTDYLLAPFPIPDGISFWSATDDEPVFENAAVGFVSDPDNPTAAAIAVYDPDGSIREPGGFRIGNGPSPRHGPADHDRERNFLEVWVGPKATARVEIRKWVPQGGRLAGYYPRTRTEDGPLWVWF